MAARTGTLTEGAPKLSPVLALEGQDEGTLLRRVASLEQASEHPLAASIVAGAKERGLPLTRPEDVRARALSGATMSNSRQNLFFAYVCNATECRLRPAR